MLNAHNFCREAHLFRSLRLVSYLISISLLLGFAGLRFASPDPNQVMHPGFVESAYFQTALQLYGALYNAANPGSTKRFDALLAGRTSNAPEVGEPKHSTSEMGRGLSALRARQTGERPAPTRFEDVFRSIDTELREVDLATSPRNRAYAPPTAQPRRIVVGE